jgi:alpha-1,2-mannosyltransferase
MGLRATWLRLWHAGLPAHGWPRVAAIAGLLLCFAALAAYLGIGMSGAVRSRQLFFNDSTAQWSFARFAMERPAAGLYDRDALHAFQRSLYPGLNRTFPYPYPPHYLFAIWPLGWLDPHAVWPVWIGATLVLFLAAACAGRWRWGEAVFLLLAPATVLNISYGQNGFLTSALVLGGMRLLPGRQVWAGVLLGLATIKPQLGLLVPVTLLAAGQWRALSAAAATVTALVALSALAFGADAWLRFAETLTGHADAIDGWVSDYRKATVAANLALAGLPRALAYQVQWGIAAAMAALVWLVFRRGITPERTALLIVAGYLATPYGFFYDLPMLTAAILILARAPNGGPRRLAWPEAAALAAGLLFPVVATLTSRFYWATSLGLSALLALAMRRNMSSPQKTVPPRAITA